MLIGNVLLCQSSPTKSICLLSENILDINISFRGFCRVLIVSNFRELPISTKVIILVGNMLVCQNFPTRTHVHSLSENFLGANISVWGFYRVLIVRFLGTCNIDESDYIGPKCVSLSKIPTKTYLKLFYAQI